MARTPDNYKLNFPLSTSAQELHTPSVSGESAIIRKLSFFNSGSTSRTVTVYVVEASGTADTGNTIAVKAIPPQKTWNVLSIQGEVIEYQQSIQAKQDTGTDVNTNMSGTTVT